MDEFGRVCSVLFRFTCQDAWPIKSGGNFHRNGERGGGCARSMKNPSDVKMTEYVVLLCEKYLKDSPTRLVEAD